MNATLHTKPAGATDLSPEEVAQTSGEAQHKFDRVIDRMTLIPGLRSYWEDTRNLLARSWTVTFVFDVFELREVHFDISIASEVLPAQAWLKKGLRRGGFTDGIHKSSWIR